tara:strand:+ start:82 stop:378 length:297 start_codon:yes stop_codon:yes gene_type:complete
MSFRELLFGYVHGETMSNDEIDYLEESYDMAIKEISSDDIEPPRAFSDICDAALIAHDSFEISCVASILDEIRPLEKGISRSEKTFNILCKAGFLISD